MTAITNSTEKNEYELSAFLTNVNLAEWFDVSKPISRTDRDMALAQMALYAFKDGVHPDSKEAEQAYAGMRTAVKRHNATICKTR
jgi:hypothetical protein